MRNCTMCIKFDGCPWRSDPNIYCSAYEQRAMTNADRIRSMNDKELATWLNCMQSNAYHCGEFGKTNAAYPYDNKAWLDWLKQEAEE